MGQSATDASDENGEADMLELSERTDYLIELSRRSSRLTFDGILSISSAIYVILNPAANWEIAFVVAGFVIAWKEMLYGIFALEEARGILGMNPYTDLSTVSKALRHEIQQNKSKLKDCVH